MNLKANFKILTVLRASYIFLVCFVFREMEAKSVGGGFGLVGPSYRTFPMIKDTFKSSPGFSSLLAIKSNQVAPQRSFQDYLDDIIKKEKRLKQQGVSLTENSRKRRTIMFKIFVFFKLLAKEVLFFGKKFLG